MEPSMKMLAASQDPSDPPEQSNRDRGRKPSKGGLARAILERRYAGGEITREQYEKIKRELGWDDGETK